MTQLNSTSIAFLSPSGGSKSPESMKLHLFNPSTSIWRIPPVIAGTPPSFRSGFGLLAMEVKEDVNALIVHGGWNGHDFVGDIHVFIPGMKT